MAVSSDPNDPNFGLESDVSSPNFGLAVAEPPQQGTPSIGEIASRAGEAGLNIVKGLFHNFERPTLKEIAGQIYPTSFRETLAGEMLGGAKQTLEQGIEAAQAPAFSKERFAFAGNVVGQTGTQLLGMIGLRGALHETAFGKAPEAAPEVPPEPPVSPTDVVAAETIAPQAPPVPEAVAPVAAPLSTEIKPTEGVPNAEQITETTRPDVNVQLPRGTVEGEVAGGGVPTDVGGEGVPPRGQGQEVPQEVAPVPTERFPYSASDAEKTTWMQSHGVFKFDELSPQSQSNVLKNFPDLAEIPESKRAGELEMYSFNEQGGEAPTLIRRQGDSLIAQPKEPAPPAAAEPAAAPAQAPAGTGEAPPPEVGAPVAPKEAAPAPLGEQAAPTEPIAEQPNTVPTPAEIHADTGGEERVGIAERYREEQQPGSVIPGVGRTADEARAFGQDFINKGGNPYDVVNQKGAKRELWQDVGVVRAEYERLSNVRRTAEDALEANPNDPQSQMALNNAELAQRQWSKDMQPVLTRAGDALRAATRSYPREINSFSDFNDIINDHFNGEVELTPEKRAQLEKAVTAIKKGNVEATEARAKVTDAAVKKAGGKTMPFEDLKTSLNQKMTKLMEECPV